MKCCMNCKYRRSGLGLGHYCAHEDLSRPDMAYGEVYQTITWAVMTCKLSKWEPRFWGRVKKFLTRS